jgi:hypothetical protein
MLFIHYQCINNELGFGLYLHGLDPCHRPWEWQVESTVIFCTVHFDRGIDQAAGTERYEGSVHWRMRDLLNVQSVEDYNQLCDLLISKLCICYALAMY